MKLAIGIGIFVVAGTSCGAHAQSLQSETGPRIAAPTPKPAGNVNNTAVEDQATTDLINVAEDATANASASTNCGLLSAKYKNLARTAKFLEKAENFLSVLGNVLSSVSIGVNISTGNTEGLIDDVQGLLISKGGCLYFGPFCPVYEFGMSVGTVINYAPKVIYGDINEPTLNEEMTNYWAQRWGDLQYGVNDEAAIRARIEQTRADIRKARADAQRAQGAEQMCKAEEVRSAVQDILAKAKAKSAPMTPADSGLSAQTDAAINDGRAGADGAISAGNAQFISTMQAAQQQELQRRAQERAAAATPGWCPTPQPDGCGCGACEGFRPSPTPAAPKGSMPISPPSQSTDECVLTEADIANGLVCTGN